MAITVADNAANAAMDAIGPLFNSGKLRIYDGSKPSDPDTAVGAQTLLAELTFGATAFGASSAGVITANAITDDSSANASGTAAWYRCVKSDGTTPLIDGTVGTSGSDLNLNSVTIGAGATVSCTAFTITFPNP